MPLISVIISVYNESLCLEALYERLAKLKISVNDHKFEFIFVDDGSKDDSREIIRKLAKTDSDVKYVFFSRNFGHEMAMTAGLDHAKGDAIVLIDADLQDPPEVIIDMIGKWKQGFEIVYARRTVRKGETILKRFTSWAFYRLIRWLSKVDIPADTGDFRLMDRCVADQILRCRERNRFFRGLIAWAGFKQCPVFYDRDERLAGETKYSFFKLVKLAFDAVLSFSDAPLRLGVTLGGIVCLISFIIGISVIIQKLVYDIKVQGYALLITAITFLGGIQLLVIGMIGEYIGRIFTESQGRPLYICKEKSDSLPAEVEGFHSNPESITQEEV
ncbi:MAG: glycosyltransferase family 2 protein [Phycisphaerae bacterium]|nr:glycosyltransferase family 2 protein [Phycisphaerae bacterium]